MGNVFRGKYFPENIFRHQIMLRRNIGRGNSMSEIKFLRSFNKETTMIDLSHTRDFPCYFNLDFIGHLHKNAHTV